MTSPTTNLLPSRSDVMKRAWQIKHNEKTEKLGPAISMAWREVKNGDFGEWHHLPIKTNDDRQQKIDKLKMDILALECKDRWNEQDYKTMEQMNAQLSQLRAQA